MAIKFDWDLCIIGAGSGGVRAARLAAAQGLKVAVAEERFWGGSCVNVGCIPKKLFLYASEFPDACHNARAYGWRISPPEFQWRVLKENKDREIQRLRNVYRELLHNSGVHTLQGRAQLLDEHQLSVAGRRHSARHILLATGSSARRPDFPGNAHASISDDIFALQKLPRRAVVVGGGYIALEFAEIFQALGVETTVLHRGEQVLRGFDQDVRNYAAQQLQSRGVQLRLRNELAKAVRKSDGSLSLHTSDGAQLETDLLLCAVGREARVAELGECAAQLQRGSGGALRVDENYRTSAESIYALGDVIEGPQLTPVALAEATVFVHRLCGKDCPPLRYEYIPTSIFLRPDIATVGFGEEAARERYKKVRIFRSSCTPLRYTMARHGAHEEQPVDRDEAAAVANKAFIKLVVDGATDRVLGAHMVGPGAAEILQGFAVAVSSGVRKSQLDATVGIHPTLAEEFVGLKSSG